MMKKHILGIIVALVWALSSRPAQAQTFTIYSCEFTGVEVKKGNSPWKPFDINLLDIITLVRTDSVRFSKGSLEIRMLKDRKDRIRTASPGKWSIGQIWDGKAVASSSDFSPVGDTPRGRMSPVSVAFKAQGKSFGTEFAPDAVLTHVAVSNLGADSLYVRVFWRDHVPGIMYPIPTDYDEAIPPHTVSVFKLDQEPLDGSTDPSSIYVCYAKTSFELILPDEITVDDFVSLIAQMGISCATHEIKYRNE